MSCDYCDKKAVYAFMDGERICPSCLSKYPMDRVECIKMIVELENKLKPFKMAASKMKEFNHDKPPIVHESDWLNLINN